MDELSRARVPPHSIEAEQSVLGSMLISSDAIDTVVGVLSQEDFYRRDHQLLFKAIMDLFNSQKPVDIITLSDYLQRRGMVGETGGDAYLIELANATPTTANIGRYSAVVHERALMRALIQVGADISRLGFHPEHFSARELTEKAEQLIYQLAEKQEKTSSFKTAQELFQKVTDTVDRLAGIGGDVTGVATGFNELDRKTSGLQPGDLIIVAGRPSMGKTTLAMNFVEHAGRYGLAGAAPLAVGVFSMEMGGEQILMRLLSSVGDIPLAHIRSGKLGPEEFNRFFSAGKAVQDMQLFIDDSSGLNAFELRSRARRLKRDQRNLAMIVVDYLQLLHYGVGREENRVAEITQISRLLKEMARELEIPVVVLSQLNRSVEKRHGRQPIMSDLRESGSIEQDADVIMFIHREEVYPDHAPETEGKAQIIISKQRNGETGILDLRFEGRYVRFANPAPGAPAFTPSVAGGEGYEPRFD